MAGLGDVLRAYMARENLTQDVAAAQFGVERGALRSALDGRVPTLENLVRFARGLGITLDEAAALALPSTETLPNQAMSDLAQRLAALVDALPEFRPIADRLLQLDPTSLRGVLAYLEVLDREP